MQVNPHKITVHIVSQTKRHVAMAILLVKLSRGILAARGAI